MQNYGQPVYERPDSTTSFVGQPPPVPPPYHQQQQWGQQPPQQQQQQAALGYNPGTYGVMPGGYAQGPQYPPTSDPYATQHADVPPPPPPKPYGFAAAVQKQNMQNLQYAQDTQNWPQPQQSNTTFAPQAQQGGYPAYSNAAPPPPSATPGSSYFPSSQGERPGSIYGADKLGASSSPVNQRPMSTVMSPNEQAPAYITPSLSGQGVQAYMPSNTNPMPGVYVPPPPDIPAWQQAQHAPLQSGNKRFTYTKPTVDPSFHVEGYQGVLQQQQQPPPLPARYEQPVVPPYQMHQPYRQQPQDQYPPQGHPPQPPQLAHDQFSQPQQQQAPPHFGQLGQPVQPLQQPYSQSTLPQSYIHQQAAQLEQYAQAHKQQDIQQAQSSAQQQSQWQAPAQFHQEQDVQHHVQSAAQQQAQWQTLAPVNNSYEQHQETKQHGHGFRQQQWQPGQQAPQRTAGQAYHLVPEQAIQAPKPVDRTGATPPNFVNQSSLQAQFPSPVVDQNGASFVTGHPTVASQTDSVSSIALANLHSQRAENRTASPKPPSFKNPTPPPPRDDASRFSALGTGGPSDWEMFGTGEEIDDEALFARKDYKHNEPVQLDSVELPAHQPSPPSTQGWPSPATQPASLNCSDRHDTYQPTPPIATVSPVHNHPEPASQQSFLPGDTLVAPLRTSPKPIQRHEAPQDAHRGFVMGEVLWDVPKQIGNASQQEQLPAPDEVSGSPRGVQVPPIPASIQVPPTNTLAPTVQTPRQTRPGVTRFFSDVGATWGLSPKTPIQSSSPWECKDDIDLAAKLKAKDEELWQFRRQSKSEMNRIQAEIEAGKAEFLATIDRLKSEQEAAKALAASQTVALNQQVEAIKAAAEQAKLDADALKKENDLTIERIKEDVEGKEDTIKERDVTIADLRGQLDDLRRRLEEERSKGVPKHPKPTALDLVSDLDPWYAGSLERYIAMLRSEANELLVEDKIKTFKGFLRAESGIRGIEYYDAAPQPPTNKHTVPDQSEQCADIHSEMGAIDEKHSLSVTIPQEVSTEDDYEYSPGGRPVLKQRRTLPLDHNIHTRTTGVTSSQSTAILTPASSIHDDSTPVQSPPEEQPQPQYKAYVPPAISTDASASLTQRQATGPPNITSPIGPGKNHDETYFGAQQQRGKQMDSRPTSSGESGGVPIVAPLNVASIRPISMSAPPKGNALDTLDSLLPAQIKPVGPSPIIEELRSEAASINSESKNVEELTRAWEKSVSLTRRKNDDARRKRAEENETHNDDLFNSDEISYAELKDLEAEFKVKESKLRSQEAMDEYKSYVETIFDEVYDDLQADIKALQDTYIEAETLLQTSVSGIRSLGGGDAPTTRACLEFLVELHEQIEKTHGQVVQAVAERDKRYKKIEIQPLYIAGNISKMKALEKHFEQAERQAVLQAKNEKAERMGELVKVAEEAVVGAASIEQSERSHIVAAIRDLKDGDNNSDVLSRAHKTFMLLQESSKSLLAIFNRLEIALNTTEVNADVAQAHVEGAPESKVQEHEMAMKARETELEDEFSRRIGVLEQDGAEFEQLIKQKGGKVETSDVLEKEKKLKMALAEAKRRNGHA